MTNSENNNQTNQESNGISTVELAVWGALLATLGDAISTIAAVQALKEEQQEQMNTQNMQKQIDHLTNEVKQLKKQINNKASWRL